MVLVICRIIDFLVIVLLMVFEVNCFFGGFFLLFKNFFDYFVWLDVFSYVKYIYIVIFLNELYGLKIRCSLFEYVVGVCFIIFGE